MFDSRTRNDIIQSRNIITEISRISLKIIHVGVIHVFPFNIPSLFSIYLILVSLLLLFLERELCYFKNLLDKEKKRIRNNPKHGFPTFA